MMKLGIDRLLEAEELRRPLAGRRVALLGHPASITRDGRHTLDALMACGDLSITAAFGPQHGMRGDKQDNMIESDDYQDPIHGIPVFSLYGKVRRPTPQMLDAFDVVLVDLQDIGTRIYTFITTLGYLLEACAQTGKSVWVLDRPNPAGRPAEGTILEPGWESFVGVGPLIMRHGLTLGEFARWYVKLRNLNVDLEIVRMEDYRPDTAPGWGWPVFELAWVNPSPNASSLNMARCFPGTVLFEGTTLSEGRGTTTALELVGAPDVDFRRVLRRAEAFAPHWLTGCRVRCCHFEPTFQKYMGRLCSGVQIHTDGAAYDHQRFRPYRLGALLLKAIRLEYPDYELWHRLPYEYETGRLAIDLLSGGTFLREWVDDISSAATDFDARLVREEQEWTAWRHPFLVY
jgi:uncharacterized protein YbbC (DUF1343 family)